MAALRQYGTRSGGYRAHTNAVESIEVGGMGMKKEGKKLVLNLPNTFRTTFYDVTVTSFICKVPVI